MTHPRHATAIHEAGHAVVGRALTMLCGAVTIAENEAENEAGHAVTHDPYDVLGEWEKREKWRSLTSVWRGRIMTVMAGAEAECEILGACAGGDGDDRCQVALMLEASEEEADRERVDARLRRATRHLVRRHRSDIERVAAALLDRETLTGPEVDALLPPGFMARPVTWDLALAMAEDPATLT